jgi:hypothetical protein
VGAGNVYYVVKPTEAFYAKFVDSHNFKYSDGSDSIHTTIQSALNACVECRDDYVLVQTSNSDWDLYGALTLSKKSVHLICRSGLGYSRGATNACRLHQNTAANTIFAISDSNIEIAGFYLKPYTDVSQITIANGSYAMNIHNNSFMLNFNSNAAEASIICSGDGGAWGQVAHKNFFESQSGDDRTVAALITIGSSATGARCDENDFFLGDGNIATIGVSNAATKGTVNHNNFMVAGTDGGFTHCIAIGSWGVAIGNRGCVGDGAIITGGVNNITNVDNMNAVDGGVIDDLD